MSRIELKGEEILKTLKPLRTRWKVWKSITKVGTFVLILGAMAIIFTSPILVNYIGNVLVLYAIPAIMILIDVTLIPVAARIRDKKRREYIEAYKRLIPQKVLEATMENGRYDFSAGYPREDFKALDLLKLVGWHTYDSEDLIEGICKGVNFRRADIRITHEEGGKDKRTVVDVDGRILEISFPTKIEGKVKVVKKKDPYTLFENDKVEMEDVDFNQKFDVFAKDNHSAFYLLTPHFMEYVKKLYDKDERVYISFDGEKVYFLQSGKGGIFEPSKGKIEIWDEVRKCKAELKEIEEIIDVLQRNEGVE